MATTNWTIAKKLESQYPCTISHLQKLVMDMADYQKNQGKKTVFGGDKGAKYFLKFKTHLGDVLFGLVSDGYLSAHTPPSECARIILNVIKEFEKAFPNWQDAYSFAQDFFGKEMEKAQKTICEVFP